MGAGAMAAWRAGHREDIAQIRVKTRRAALDAWFKVRRLSTTRTLSQSVKAIAAHR